MIGHLSSQASASTFSDFLVVQGISNVVEAEKDGWAVWIHSEDEIGRASELLTRFLGDPSDPSYHKHARQANEVKAREREEETAAGKRIVGRKRLFRGTMPFGVGPLTFVLMLACLIIWGAMWIYPQETFLNAFSITRFEINGSYDRGLPEIRHGEVWRLFSPVLLHDWPSPFHLMFNLYALLILGSAIEARQGAWRLGWLVLLTSVFPNLAQYAMSGPNFLGISGVVYGLLGYIWMKGRFDPDSGLYLHPQTVTVMLVWFFLCLAGVIPHIANTVHGVGLVIGMACGWISSLHWLRDRL